MSYWQFDEARGQIGSSDGVGVAGKVEATLIDVGSQSIRESVDNQVHTYREYYVWRQMFELEPNIALHEQLTAESTTKLDKFRLWLYVRMSRFSQGDGMVPWVELRQSYINTAVLGIFALREFRKGEIIGWMFPTDRRAGRDGAVSRECILSTRPVLYGMGMSFIQNITEKGIGATCSNGFQIKPNCEVHSNGCMCATKGIHKGRELYAVTSMNSDCPENRRTK